MNLNEEIKRLAEQQMDAQFAQFDAEQEEEKKRIEMQEEEQRKQEELENKLDIKNFQKENGEFDIDLVKKVLYEVEYYQETIEENKVAEKQSRQSLLVSKSEYEENIKLNQEYDEKIKELEKEISILDEKNKYITEQIGGKITKKDKELRESLVNQIDELNKKKEQSKKDKSKAKEEYDKSLEIYTESKSANKSNINKNLLQESEQKLFRIFEYCLMKTSEIDYKLNNIFENVKVEEDISVREEYFKKYVELSQERDKYYNNYKNVLDLINNYTLTEDIYDEFDKIEEKVANLKFDDQKIMVENTENIEKEENILFNNDKLQDVELPNIKPVEFNEDSKIEESSSNILFNNDKLQDVELPNIKPVEFNENSKIEESSSNIFENTPLYEQPDLSDLIEKPIEFNGESEIEESNSNIFENTQLNDDKSEELNPFVDKIFSDSNVTEWDEEKNNIENVAIKPEAVLENDNWINGEEQENIKKEVQSAVDYEVPSMSPSSDDETSLDNSIESSNSKISEEDSIDDDSLDDEVKEGITIKEIKDAAANLIDTLNFKFHKFWFSEEKFDEWQESKGYTR